MSDNTFMQKALDLAAKGKGRTSPNPMVGAVVVKSGKIISGGYHRKAGTSHAEVIALKKPAQQQEAQRFMLILSPAVIRKKERPPVLKRLLNPE